MKPILYLKLISVVFIIFLSGCSWLYQSHQTEAMPTNVTDLTQANLQLPPLQVLNQFGEEMNTEELRGQVWVANMIFVRCPTVCQMMTPNMMLLQNTLMDEGLDVKLLSFTVDPEFDTPEQLKSYGEAYQADFEYWTFLTGYTPEEITEFAAAAFLSPVMEIEGSDDMIHATSFFLINENGQVIRKYDGLDPNQDAIIQDLKNYMKK